MAKKLIGCDEHKPGKPCAYDENFLCGNRVCTWTEDFTIRNDNSIRKEE